MTYTYTAVSVSVDPKYIQDKNRPPHPNLHWTGIPRGSSYHGKCWLCAYGCAVLSYLYWKDLEPDESHVTDCLNGNADFDWSRKGLVRSDKIVAPSIAKVAGRQHYVYIKEELPGPKFNIFDPDAAQKVNQGGPPGPEKFDYCWKPN